MAQPAVSTYTVAAGQPIHGGRWPGGRLGGGVTLDATAASGLLQPAGQMAGGVVLANAVAGGVVGNVLAPAALVSDGIWTWFTKPEAVQIGSYVYVGWVDSAGTCGATQIALSDYSTKHFSLSSVGLEVDDHNNASFAALSGGKIAVFYGKHNDASFRYRVFDGSGAFDSSGSWGTEQARGTGEGNYSYPTPVAFDADSPKVRLFHRRWFDSGTERGLSYRTATDLTTAAPHTWSVYNDVFRVAGQRPYFRIAYSASSGRMHVAITNGHPAETATSLYHFYGQLDGSNVLRWYTSAGVEITATQPFTTTDVTQIYDGTTTRCWVSDCAIHSDGHPRILWMKYPGNDGLAIELWHARWTGAAWSTNKIADDGARLYAAEAFYHGGACFDASDADHVYVSTPVSGVRQIRELSTSDNGSTWTEVRQITSGGTAGNPLKARPISVRDGNGQINVMWWEGTYTTYTSYSTSIKGAT